MIVAVTPNGSVDITVQLAGTATGEEQDVVMTSETAGGKGHNAARFLASLGHSVTALGFAGGWTGQRMRDLLEEAGVATRLTPVGQSTRLFTTVSDATGARQVSYHMAGPDVTAADIDALLADIAQVATPEALLLLGGSLPPGSPPDFYARAIECAGAWKVIVDAGGAALRAAVARRPYMVKINHRELESLCRISLPIDAGDLIDHIARLAQSSGVSRWWVTLGPQGAIGWEEGAVTVVAALPIQARNSSGAGDAFTAGLLHQEIQGAPGAAKAGWATACAAAVCEQPSPTVPPRSRVLALFSDARPAAWAQDGTRP